MLSSESQVALTALLPTTAFHGFQSSMQQGHPSATDQMAVDQPVGPPSGMLDTSVFTDPHFLAAARTFQDHIYSNWMSDAHREKVKRFQASIRDGTLAAAWKDDLWYNSNKSTQPDSIEKIASSGNMVEFSVRAGYVLTLASFCALNTFTPARPPKSGLLRYQRKM
jgi:Asx homology domain